jgi:hypothetical protein
VELPHHPLPYRRVLVPPHRTDAARESSRIGTLARKQYASAAFQRTSFLVILLTGAVTSLYLMRLNQDIRQQASTPYPPVASAAPVVPPDAEPLTTLDPLLFAQLASTGNTNSFVITPDELNYNPDTVRIDEDVDFPLMEEEGYWARGFEWHDLENKHEYHSTIWGFIDPDEAEETYATFNSKSNVTYFGTAKFDLAGVDSDQITLFQANDPDETINFSFYVNNYLVVLKAKNTPIDTAFENLETMANLLIEDLTVPTP